MSVLRIVLPDQKPQLWVSIYEFGFQASFTLLPTLRCLYFMAPLHKIQGIAENGTSGYGCSFLCLYISALAYAIPVNIAGYSNSLKGRQLNLDPQSPLNAQMCAVNITWVTTKVYIAQAPAVAVLYRNIPVENSLRNNFWLSWRLGYYTRARAINKSKNKED